MSKKKSISFKETLKISLWSLGINWKMSKAFTILSITTSIYSNLTGLINTYLVARVVDQLISIIGKDGTSIESLVPYIILIGVVRFIDIANNELHIFSLNYKWRLAEPFLTRMRYQKIHSLGVQTNLLPSVSNKRKMAEESYWEIMSINDNLTTMIATFIQALVASYVVFSFSIWVGIAVLIVSFITYLQSRYYVRKNFEWRKSEKNVEERRKTYFYTYNLTNPDSLDEIALVGSYPFFDKKFTGFYKYFNSILLKLMKAESISSFAVKILNLFVLLGGSIQVFLMALNRLISIGDTTFYIGAINTFYSGVSVFSNQLVLLTDRIYKCNEVYEFFNLEPVVQDGNNKLERLTVPPLIEIKNISFHYPNSKVNVFENFSLTINSGEKIALVGENGAGKSTLVKLLCRIYDPQKGNILINGVDLKDLTLNDWYKNIGVLFQDFSFYGSLSVEDNIYIGKPVKKLDRKRIIESAKNADAHDFIMKYKRKYQTIMNDQFKGGIKPSKGQQQKIAIARFFYRDAPFAIFDEPTSAIDADAEYRIFNRIYNFFDNKTVMIISHRFSTVRNADRIYVVRNGKIIEKGTHKDLIQKKGVYADNFRKQAEGYN